MLWEEEGADRWLLETLREQTENNIRIYKTLETDVIGESAVKVQLYGELCQRYFEYLNLSSFDCRYIVWRLGNSTYNGIITSWF